MPSTRPLRRSPSFEVESVRHETPKWGTFWLLAAFGLLIGIGVVTVLLPELHDEPEPAVGSDAPSSEPTGSQK